MAWILSVIQNKICLTLLIMMVVTSPPPRMIFNIIQIMPGLEGDLEEWQTQEVNVTILQGHRRAQALFVLLFPTVLLFHAHINIHWFSSCEMTDSHTLGLLRRQFYDELQK